MYIKTYVLKKGSMAYFFCQAQSQLQLNWTELALVSISPTRPASQPE